MTKKHLISVVLMALLFSLALVACGGGGGGETSAVGDAKAGEALFNEAIIDVQPGCNTCHSLTPDTVVVGPSLAGVATRAETRISGMSAEDYIRESILHPDNYVVEGFTAGVMVQVWEETLTPEQVDNLTAYLLTLK
ncbi:MAG: cytochrome c [Anaerolineales bacterium]|nr:cytochrome c [Anaerolineales bacterium]